MSHLTPHGPAPSPHAVQAHSRPTFYARGPRNRLWGWQLMEAGESNLRCPAPPPAKPFMREGLTGNDSHPKTSSRSGLMPRPLFLEPAP